MVVVPVDVVPVDVEVEGVVVVPVVDEDDDGVELAVPVPAVVVLVDVPPVEVLSVDVPPVDELPVEVLPVEVLVGVDVAGVVAVPAVDDEVGVLVELLSPPVVVVLGVCVDVLVGVCVDDEVAGAWFTIMLGGVDRLSACAPGIMNGAIAPKKVRRNCSYVMSFSLKKAGRQRITLCGLLSGEERNQEDAASESMA